MLMSSQINRYAHQLLDARNRGQPIPPLTSRYPLALEEGYEIARRILDIRIAEGETPIGRKIGFASNSIRKQLELDEVSSVPIWSYIYDKTVSYAEDNVTSFDLKGMLLPRIEPEIVFKLKQAPEPGITMDALADCIEWMAHGIELTSSIFTDSKLQAADVVAAFGMHGALIIGEPKIVSESSRKNLSVVTSASSVSLSRDGILLAAGFGSEVLNSPLHALWHLHQMLQGQTLFAPLGAGEIVTTGSWTDSYPVSGGQTWQTAFSGLQFEGMTVSFGG